MVKRKRIVVTGMGVLTALGNSVDEFREGLFAAKASIRPSEHFLKYFDHAMASEVLQPVDYEGIAEELLPELDRTVLWSVQTPQAFRAALLREAHDKARRDGFVGTDEAMLVERL